MNYDTIIEKHNVEKQEYIRLMENKKQEILKDIEVFVRDWFEKETIRTVKNKADKIFELGEEKARALKEEANKLKNDTTALVEKHFNDPNIWWHKKEKSAEYYISHNKILPELDEPLRYLLGELGVLFSKHDLDDDTSNCAERWRSDYRDKARYAYAIMNPESLSKLSKEYKELIDKCRDINKEIAQVESTKKRENIEEWWTTL